MSVFITVLFQGLYECVSLCFHPFGVVLAAGSTEGHLVVLNAENGAPVVTIRVCGSPLNCLGYNPGKYFNDSMRSKSGKPSYRHACMSSDRNECLLIYQYMDDAF